MCLCWRRGILRISLTAAILCLFPSYAYSQLTSDISSKTIIPAMPQKSSRIFIEHNGPRQVARELLWKMPLIPFAAAPLESPVLRLAPLPHRKIPWPAFRNHLPGRLQLERPALAGQRAFARICRRGHLNPHQSTVTVYKERSLRRL
jgi:hypothetical protein